MFMKKFLILIVTMSMLMSGCSATDSAEKESGNIGYTDDLSSESVIPQKESITINETYTSNEDGEHAIEADGEDLAYANIKVVKSGDSDGDEADFYGGNAAVFATNEATLDLNAVIVETNGTHANGVFSYGDGTTVNIADSIIETSGNCSGGLMTTGGGTMNASNLNIHTTGNSSAAIRSDRGGGTVSVQGGYYLTEGKGSPVIYSTADITVSDAYLESVSSQGIVVEGQNSVTLDGVELVANNVSKNSDKSDWYQAVMIYQSMSGDADEGTAAFTMKDGSLLNRNGDIFFVNNTIATIDLRNVAITNEDQDAVFLRAAAAGWGNEGSNGGQVTLYLTNQEVDGDFIVDDVSSLNLYLQENSSITGAINKDEENGGIYVEIAAGCKWILTGDSYITSLTCAADGIDLNGYKLYVDGIEYAEGTESTGEAIEVTVKTEGKNARSGSDERPGGDHRSGDSNEPPKKPE